MPAFNAERWIGAALESILQQTLTNFELIISDNASLDGTLSICRDYAKKDSRIIIISNPINQGASENYNLVYRKARAPYFKWASSNDYCHAHLLQRCTELLERRADAVLAYPKTMLYQQNPADGEPCDDDLDLDVACATTRFRRFIERIRLNNLMNGVFRTAALGNTALIRPYLASDVVLMAEVLLRGPFVEVPEYLFFRSMNPDTATKLKSRRETVEHLDPAAGGRMLFQPWREQCAYFRAVAMAPLSPAQKLDLFSYLARGVIVARQHFWNDVVFSMRCLMSARRLDG
ncbi:MAG: glycosyltransferase family A protein [Aquisalimonadaceae bacterium]